MMPVVADLAQWAQGTPGAGLVDFAAPLPGIPDPRLKKSRSRPNRGRKRRYVGPMLTEPPWDLLRETGYPLPTTIECLPRVPPQWRSGPKANKWRVAVRARWGTTCHICGHDGAKTADHLVPLSLWGNQPYDPELSRPAHGIEGCPTCYVKCNSSRGNKQLGNAIRDYKPPIQL